MTDLLTAEVAEDAESSQSPINRIFLINSSLSCSAHFIMPLGAANSAV